MLGVGIIGCGRISDLHARTYLSSGECQIVAICDTELAKAEEAAVRWGLQAASIYGRFEDLLDDGQVDAVEILVPHQFHRTVAVAAAEAGKHVALQKPMARTLVEADAILSAAEEAGVVLKVYENFLFYPPVVKAAEAIQDGAIGNPLSIHLKSNSGDPRFGWPVPDDALEWRDDRSLSGGGRLTFDDGHHKIAVARSLLGDVTNVHARIFETPIGKGRVLDAPGAIVFEFEGGRLGTWDVTYSPGLLVETEYYTQYDPIEVTGSEGILWINHGHGRTLAQAPVVVYRDGQSYHYDGVVADWGASFDAAVSNTIDTFTGKDSPSLSGEEARRILEIAVAISEAARLETGVQLPAQGDQMG